MQPKSEFWYPSLEKSERPISIKFINVNFQLPEDSHLVLVLALWDIISSFQLMFQKYVALMFILWCIFQVCAIVLDTVGHLKGYQIFAQPNASNSVYWLYFHQLQWKPTYLAEIQTTVLQTTQVEFTFRLKHVNLGIYKQKLKYELSLQVLLQIMEIHALLQLPTHQMTIQ